MGTRYVITKEEAELIREYRKKVKDKREDKRLYAVQLRGEGMKNDEVAEKLDSDKRVISSWVRRYKEKGLEGLLTKKRTTGGHYNLTFEEEAELLKPFEERAQKGEMIETGEIKEAYRKVVGHSIGGGQIYMVLKRHGWRKIMPRSRHPKAADKEAVEASKKLKDDTTK